ncbi:PRC-barrel domain containing protein [Azospirillum sp. B21]|uniref:PRC-barrel domain-containing protein n=1 Tax=Azospirillum sp. B21 TaxID=2607496 RepID=UPI0011EF462C|nr:PRC-barrel domain-containing protein [Azospirillum sp. B21]KAA0578921.1 PRC-barrel domain containing protein [Azospirillum sp. B21]
MLRPVLLLPAALLLMTGTTLAQTAPTPGAAAETMAQGTAPPLMTAPRPDDQPTTGPVASPPGVSGEAPSQEMQNQAPPAGSPPVAALPSASLNPDQARSMVGTELRTRDGQPGGRILDFTLSQPGDRIDRIVVAPNDVLGLGDKLVALPAGALTNGPDGPVLDMEQADIGKAPTFAYGSEPTVTRPDNQ